MELAIYKFDHNNRLDDLTTFESGGEIWFVATDVCGLPDIKNVSDAVAGLEEDEKMVSVIPRVSKNVKVVFPQGLRFRTLRELPTAGSQSAKP